VNRNIRIGGAVVLGVGIILAALYVRDQREKEKQDLVSAVPVTQADRSYVPYTDSDGDGISDWEEELRTRTHNVTTVVPIDTEASADDSTPLTLTDSFAQNFFEDYIKYNASGSLSEEAQSAFLNNSLSSIAGEVTDELYTISNISIGPNTNEYLRTYGNSVAGIIQTHSTQKESETKILERALASENPDDLLPLNDFVKLYDSVISKTLVVAAPPELAIKHIALLNAYVLVRNDIEGMTQSFSDPLYATVRISRYEDDINNLYTALSDIYRYLYDQGVRYTEGEPASMFKITP